MHPLDKPLTPREIEVLEMIAEGKSLKDIAQEFGISYQTVKNHSTSAYYKFGVRSKTQAAVKVWTLGLPRSANG